MTSRPSRCEATLVAAVVPASAAGCETRGTEHRPRDYEVAALVRQAGKAPRYSYQANAPWRDAGRRTYGAAPAEPR